MKTRLLSGGTWVCGETIVPEGLTGLQLSFYFTVRTEKAQLRDYMNQSQQGLQADSCDGVYSFEDLQFASELAKSYKEQLTYWDGRTYNETDDYALGKKLGTQFREIQDALSKSSVTDNMKSVFEDSFQSYMDELMKKMDQKIHDNRQHTIYGLRQHSIDRNAVYRAFHDTLSAG